MPFDKNSPFVTSGIRIGTAAITTRGMNQADCGQIVEWIDRALMNKNDSSMLQSIHHEVNEFASSFRLYPDE